MDYQIHYLHASGAAAFLPRKFPDPDNLGKPVTSVVE